MTPSSPYRVIYNAGRSTFTIIVTKIYYYSLFFIESYFHCRKKILCKYFYSHSNNIILNYLYFLQYQPQVFFI